ncbi:MAG: hypothetical protein IT461_13630 [Planctomycetes bacterium]|nr:hypothetical protein [Planctomycetota bacterium]
MAKGKSSAVATPPPSAKKPSKAQLDKKKSIEKDLREAVGQALRRHKLLGNPVVVWRDGKAVEIPPEEIPVDPKTGEFLE